MAGTEQRVAPITQRSGRRGGIKGELALALPPTLIVLGVIFLIEGLTAQRLLFASLASSAFLVYLDPNHRMNTTRVMVSSQMLACVLGVGTGLLFGEGYLAGAIAMASAIVVLILLDIVHPPAVSTALAFAFVPSRERTLALFLSALVLIAALVIVQRIAVWTLHRFQIYVEERL
jgi:CBS-domain-containing membrane protein